MNQAIKEMLAEYDVKNSQEAVHALKEIFQEIALLALHRANFFERAAFYGGTALRILYQLPRFSEDLDFTLISADPNFSLKNYFSAIENEFSAFGLEVSIEPILKQSSSEIESAFLKTNTRIHFLNIDRLTNFADGIPSHSKIQIKIEVDTDPATDFEKETRYLMRPISFPIVTLKKPDLFAGKLHALLYRAWKQRVKGRDFYDFVWYLRTKTPVRLAYLKEKAIQSGHAKIADLNNLQDLKALLIQRFKAVNFQQAREDVRPFIRDQRELEVWGEDFFSQITERIEIV